MNNGINRQTSLRDKLKSSICCFTGSVHHHDPLDQGEGFYNKLHIPRTPISPAGSSTGGYSSWWLKKSPTGEYGNGGEQPRVRGRSLKSRMGRSRHHHHHRQSQSADFSYDPSSYALNFESESPEDDENFPLRNFSARLPASPPSPASPINYSGKEIVGYS